MSVKQNKFKVLDPHLPYLLLKEGEAGRSVSFTALSPPLLHCPRSSPLSHWTSRDALSPIAAHIPLLSPIDRCTAYAPVLSAADRHTTHAPLLSLPLIATHVPLLSPADRQRG